MRDNFNTLNIVIIMFISILKLKNTNGITYWKIQMEFHYKWITLLHLLQSQLSPAILWSCSVSLYGVHNISQLHTRRGKNTTSNRETKTSCRENKIARFLGMFKINYCAKPKSVRYVISSKLEGGKAQMCKYITGSYYRPFPSLSTLGPWGVTV